MTLNELGDNVIPSFPVSPGRSSQGSTLKKFKTDAKNINRLIFARFSPMQRRLPKPEIALNLEPELQPEIPKLKINTERHEVLVVD